MSFVKLDVAIINSTIWEQTPPVCKVWITMLVMADKNGLVSATAPGIAKQACMITQLDQVREAVKYLESPDEDSKCQAHDGRRILRVEGGYKIVNYMFYRVKGREEARTEYHREYWKKRKSTQHHSTPLNTTQPTQPIADADAEADADAKEPKVITKKRSDTLQALSLRKKRETQASQSGEKPLNGSGICIPTNVKGLAWEVPQIKIAEWADTYPGVDVLGTLKEIRQWCTDNPARRKTKNGMPRFINAWLSREQNKP